MPEHRREKRRAAMRMPQTAGGETLDHLVVIRESSAYDLVLMEGMIAQTLAKVAHLPGATRLQSIGIDILSRADYYGAFSQRTGSSRMVMIEDHGTLYLYSMGSAAKKDYEDQNAFGEYLCSIIRTYRPREVWAVSITRLMRAAENAGALLAALSECTEVLHCETDVTLATPEGKMVFQILAMFAAMERDTIVRRHTAGRVAQWRRNEWIPTGWPPGYRLEKQKLKLDESAIESVRQMLRLLGNSALSSAECAQAIGDLGITTPSIERYHGKNATIADARNPTEAIRTLRQWAGVYETGRHEVPWANPFPGVDHIAGVHIEPRDGYAHGVLVFAYELARPEGGWGDRDTFAAIRDRANATGQKASGGACHKMVPPLSHFFSWKEDSFEYSLSSRDRRYQLIRRPYRSERQFTGWAGDHSDEQEVVAVIRRSELHTSLAQGIIDAIKDGLPVELDAYRFVPTGLLPPLSGDHARLRKLEEQIADVERALSRARRNAGSVDDDDVAQLFLEDIKRHSARKRQLTAELSKLAEQQKTPQLAEVFESNADLAAHALAALAQGGGVVPVSVRDALRTVISAERMNVDAKTVTWECHIELPHPQGTVILGPIRGQVPNRRRQRTEALPRKAQGGSQL